MPDIEREIFVCIDCETTGLDPKKDRIIEVAAVTFDANKIHETYESLVNPKTKIPQETINIHGISEDMVKGHPTIEEVLPEVMKLVKNRIIVGHGIQFDIDIIENEAIRVKTPVRIKKNQSLDTLRMARNYGESPQNSLEQLCKHFNVPFSGAHRAMKDVVMNIEVFKYLCHRFKTTEQIFKMLSKPILLKEIPFGKHKGRPLKEVPLDYLLRIAKKDFDLDLTYSIRSEINRRKKGNQFCQAGNPFQNL